MHSFARAGLASLFIAAVGCGSGSSPGSASSAGVPGSRFTITVRGETPHFDAASATTVFLPYGGRVTAAGGLSCGIVGGVTHTSCSADFPWGSADAPRIVAVTATPDADAGYGHHAFAGACTGSGACMIRGNADKVVLVRFARTQQGLGGHPNFSQASVHGPRYRDFAAGAPGALRCTDCHGANLQGQGIALSCSVCHAWPIDLFWDQGSWDKGWWQ
jgi:hypothetical protein